MKPDTRQHKLDTARRNLRYIQNLLRTCPMERWRIRNIAEDEERRLIRWIQAAEQKLVVERQ